MELYVFVYCDHMTKRLATSDKTYQNLQWFAKVLIKGESHNQDKITNESTDANDLCLI